MFEAFLRILKWSFIATWLLVVVSVFWGSQIMAFLFHDIPFMGSSFNQTHWASAEQCSGGTCELKDESECTRARMFRDLKNTHLLVGAPRNDIEKLIGKGSKRAASTCLTYDLGMCSGLGIDMDYLQVCYDSSNKVKSVNHHQS